MNLSQHFDLLVEKYLAGSLSGDERTQLRELLRTDAHARGEFARILIDESTFRGLHEAGIPSRDPIARPQPPLRPWPERPLVRRSGRTSSSPYLRLTLAAVILLGVASGMAWLLERSHGGSRSTLIPASSHLMADIRIIAHGHGGTIHHDGAPERRLNTGELIDIGDQIRTGEDGSCVLGYRDEDTRIELSASTEMTLLDPQPGKHFQLSRGMMNAHVAPQAEGHPMLVSTPQATVRVIGTRFMLTVDADTTRLTVSEGKVHCQASNGQALVVPAGAGAIASAGGVQASVPGQTDILPPAGTITAFGDWQPLTPPSSLGEWTPFSGDWSCVDATLIGIMDARTGHARLDSKSPVRACEISCSIRGINCSYAEFGVHDYAGSFPIRLGTQQAWHTLHVVVRAATASCEVDGIPIVYEGGTLATGNVGFFASSNVAGARIEISRARIRK